MDAIINAIIQKATWKKGLLFTLLFAVFFTLINYSSAGVAGLQEITGGASILDFEMGYTHAEAHEMLTSLGTEGRTFYLTRIVPLDFPFPLACMLMFTGWIALLIKQIKPKNWNKYLLFIPVLAMMSDWLENAGIITLLKSYPDLSERAVSYTSILGMIKLMLLSGNIVITVILIVVLILSLIRRNPNTRKP